MRSGAHSSISRSMVARNRAWARLVRVRATRYSTATEASITTGPARRPSRDLAGVAVTPDQRRGAWDPATRDGPARFDIVQKGSQLRGVRLETASQQADRFSADGRIALGRPAAQRLVGLVRHISHVECRHIATLAALLACCNQLERSRG